MSLVSREASKELSRAGRGQLLCPRSPSGISNPSPCIISRKEHPPQGEHTARAACRITGPTKNTWRSHRAPPPNRDCKQTAPSRSSPEASQLIPSFSLADLLVFQEPPQVLVSTVPLPILNNSTHPIHKSSCLCRFSTERVLSSFSRPHLLAKSGLPTHPFQFWFWTRCFYVQACFLVCRVPRLYTSSLRTVTQGAGLAHPCSGPNFSLLPLPRDS